MRKSGGLTGFTRRQLIEKSSTTIVAATIVSAVALSFAIVTLNFLWDLSGHYNRVLAEKNHASKILKQNVENIEQLQANFNVLEAGDVKADTILDALPSKYDYPALATTIESLVSDSGLNLDSFNGSDLESEAVQQMTSPEPVEVKFSISVSGTYENVQKLIRNIDRTIRPMKITRLNLKGSDKLMKSSIYITTYYQPSTSLDVETRTIE